MVPVWVTTGRPVSWLRTPVTPPSQSQTSGTLSEEIGPLQSRGRRRHRPKGYRLPVSRINPMRTVALSLSGLTGEINGSPRICRMTSGPFLR